MLRRNRTGCWINGMYADDMWLLSPTQDGLQEMVQICSDYCKNLNLSFSTHPDSRRSKTKCIVYKWFTKKQKTLIVLDGCELPWVSHAKHLGHKISFKINGLSEGVMEQRATYIKRVNELNQEFYFANSTKITINNIFNSSFYGSRIWGLFSDEAVVRYSTYNAEFV